MEDSVIAAIITFLSGFTFLLILSLFIARRYIVAQVALAQYARATKRSVITIRHTEQGLFGGSMLIMTDVLKVERHLRKIGNRPVDIVLTTFGGDMISGLRLARIIKRCPNARLVVPKYAFSAGTIVAIAAPAILADTDAMFGPIDPQFGGLFDGYHSAKDWQHIAAHKKGSARDATIANAEVGRRLMREVRCYVDKLLPGPVDRARAYDLLLDGDASHARAITPDELAGIGLNVTILPTTAAALLTERVPEGVFSYTNKAKEARA